MKKLFFVMMTMLFITLNAHAQGQTNACYQNEEDPKSQQAFSSQEIYEQTLQEWRQKAPTIPNPFELFKAYGVYKKEKERALGLKTDKQSHCFIGCRIAQAVNYKTAQYVGWLKEDQDLRDCNMSTHFDEADLDATLVGAHFGGFEQSPEGCLKSCEKQNF